MELFKNRGQGKAEDPNTKLQSLQELHQRIVSSDTYTSALTWGDSRPGHPEGNLGKHIEMLHDNFSRIIRLLGPDEILSKEQLLVVNILIDSHDILKPHARTGVPISHPKSHASLAANWIKSLGGSNELAVMVALHDEHHALFRMNERSSLENPRVDRLVNSIRDWDAYLVFQMCDKVGPGRIIDSISFLLDLLDQSRITYSVPARRLISELCEHHKINYTAEATGVDVAKTNQEMLTIELKDLPAVKEIRAIDSLSKLNLWCANLRGEIEKNPHDYYNSENVTENFLELSKQAPLSYSRICQFADVSEADEVGFPELAVRILQKVKN
jgi:hypothetical protein